MDDKQHSLESDNGGHNDEHLHHKRERIDSEHEDPGVTGCDTLEEQALELAIQENITVGKAYSRLTAKDEDKPDGEDSIPPPELDPLGDGDE